MDVTDRIGEQIMKYRYDAFGSLFNEMQAPYNAVGFTGKTYDAKAGLIDFAARWYSPNEGRFTTMDTFPGWSDLPASQNRYSYAHNNPSTYTDPSGHCIPTDDGGCIIPPLPGSGSDGGNTGGGSGDTGGSDGDSGGSDGSPIGPVAPPPPPPPTFEEILAMRTGEYNGLSGYMPGYGSYSGWSSQWMQDDYVFGKDSFDFGFGAKSLFGSFKKMKPKKFKFPSFSFGQAASTGLDFIPVVGNIKSGLEALTGKDLITGRKLSAADRAIALAGVFTGGAGKTALKGAKAGLGFAQGVSKGRKVSKGTVKDIVQKPFVPGEYWKKKAPQNATPGSKIIHYRNYNGKTEKSTVIYDDFGRQKYRIDHSDHSMPKDHSVPHLHEYKYGPGYHPEKGKEFRYNFWRKK